MELPDFEILHDRMVFKGVPPSDAGEDLRGIKVYSVLSSTQKDLGFEIIEYTDPLRHKTFYLDKQSCCEWLNKCGGEGTMENTDQELLEKITVTTNKIKHLFPSPPHSSSSSSSPKSPLVITTSPSDTPSSVDLETLKEKYERALFLEGEEGTVEIDPKNLEALLLEDDDEITPKKTLDELLLEDDDDLDNETEITPSISLKQILTEEDKSKKILDNIYEEGIKKNLTDPTKAKAYFLFAAQNGHGEAALRLGNMLEEGIGGPKDQVSANNYFLLAVEVGNREAALKLGLMYKEGLSGFPKDREKAAQAFELIKPEQSQYSEACHQLGLICEPKSSLKAINFFITASNKGHAGAAAELQNVYGEITDLSVKSSIAKNLLTFYYSARNSSEVTGWEKEYHRLRSIQISAALPPRTTLLAISNNDTDIEHIIRNSDESMSSLFESKKQEMVDGLKKIGGIVGDTETVPFSTLSGACLGMVTEHIFETERLSSFSETGMVEIAKKSENRPGITAIAIQAIYTSVHAKVDKKLLPTHSIYPVEPNAVPYSEALLKIINKHQTDYSAFKITSEVQNLEFEAMPELGISKVSGEKDYLDKWLKTPDGHFGVTITLDEGSHALAFKKIGGEVYFFDPNFFTLKCPAEPAIIMELLKIFYPSTENHEICIYRVSSKKSSSSSSSNL